MVRAIERYDRRQEQQERQLEFNFKPAKPQQQTSPLAALSAPVAVGAAAGYGAAKLAKKISEKEEVELTKFELEATDTIGFESGLGISFDNWDSGRDIIFKADEIEFNREPPEPITKEELAAEEEEELRREEAIKEIEQRQPDTMEGMHPPTEPPPVTLEDPHGRTTNREESNITTKPEPPDLNRPKPGTTLEEPKAPRKKPLTKEPKPPKPSEDPQPDETAKPDGEDPQPDGETPKSDGAPELPGQPIQNKIESFQQSRPENSARPGPPKPQKPGQILQKPTPQELPQTPWPGGGLGEPGQQQPSYLGSPVQEQTRRVTPAQERRAPQINRQAVFPKEVIESPEQYQIEPAPVAPTPVLPSQPVPQQSVSREFGSSRRSYGPPLPVENPPKFIADSTETSQNAPKFLAPDETESNQAPAFIK